MNSELFHQFYPTLTVQAISTLDFGSTHSTFLVETASRTYFWKYSPKTSLGLESLVYSDADSELRPHLFEYYPCQSPHSLLLTFEEGFTTAWDLVQQGEISTDRAIFEGISLLSIFHKQDFFATHQDFHLGQFGKTKSGRWVIFDFEGLPELAHRGVHWQAMDIVGLLRSVDYAHKVKSESKSETSPSDILKCQIQGALQLYGMTPSKGFLKVFYQLLLRRAQYELSYEKIHRPEMAWIPELGISEVRDLILRRY